MTETIQPGPPIEAIQGGDPTGAASASAGAGDSEATHHRVRIERSDGSRFWHVEETGDADTAIALARGRGMGTVIRAEPLEGSDDDDE